MNKMRILAVVLIVAGLLGLAYGGFSYTSRTHRANIGPLTFAVREQNTVNVPIWVGIGAIAVGGGMLLVGSKGRRS